MGISKSPVPVTIPDLRDGLLIQIPEDEPAVEVITAWDNATVPENLEYGIPNHITPWVFSGCNHIIPAAVGIVMKPGI